jgi:glycosyltransferase involved in cell wall biosynthesis
MSIKTEKIKVLFVYPRLDSYIRRDLDMLKRHFDVKPLETDLSIVPKSWKDLSAFLQLLRGVKWADVVFSWLINMNAFYIELFRTVWRKKSIIVAGADAAVYVPEIDYGVWRHLRKFGGLKFLLKHSTRVLAVSESNKNEALKHAHSQNIKLVYNGVDSEKFKPSGLKEDLVLTVGAVCRGYLIRKGLETFVKASEYLPHVTFVLIGKHEDQSVNYLKSIAGPNVKFPGFVSEERLLRYYQAAKVYCQLSAHEAFGVALAEAMSCGCVPVVTRRYAIPEVVGDTGFYVPYGEPRATAEMVKESLKSDKGSKARERIKSCFSLEAREEKLVQEILDITKMNLFH